MGTEPMRNPWLCIIIISSLALGMLAGLGGIIALACLKIQAPESLVAVVSACVGGLSSFLVSPPRGSVGIPCGGEVTELTVTKGGP